MDAVVRNRKQHTSDSTPVNNENRTFIKRMVTRTSDVDRVITRKGGNSNNAALTSSEKSSPSTSAALSKSWSGSHPLPSTSSSSDDSETEITGKSSLHGRSASEYSRRMTRKRLERCNSAPETSSVFSDLLSSSRRVVAGAEELVWNVIEAGKRLVHHHSLPDWLKDNEYLIYGHRLPLNSFRQCFKSVFRIHTETGNIWTHLIGMVAFIFIAAYTLSSRYIDWMWQDITVHSVFFGGAILCLTFSWVFHTVFCHSENVNKLFSKLDYCGIALLTVGSFVPWLYYGFYHSEIAHLVYLVSIIVLGTSCIVVSLFDRFATPAYRPLRAGLFIALGLTGVVPACHFVINEGFQCAVYEFGFPHLVAMAVLYIAGALLYAFRIPESIWPGKFDIWFQSHQIFHICVNLAALVHFRGVQVISHARLTSLQCVQM